MLVKVTLVDMSPRMIAAWRETFAENPEIEIVHGSMLDQPVSAWVSPTGSGGRMDGELDAMIEGLLGEGIERALQAQIAERHAGAMPVGHATCVATGRPVPRYLISPTLASTAESDAMAVALAAAAAFQAVHMQNALHPASITSVALPGIGASLVPVEICADLMWTAYDLFRTAQFPDYVTMRAALVDLLGDLGPTSTRHAYKKSFGQPPATAFKATVPDTAAAQAQLKKMIEQAQRETLGDDHEGEGELE